jgi:hypothetical protein
MAGGGARGRYGARTVRCRPGLAACGWRVQTQGTRTQKRHHTAHALPSRVCAPNIDPTAAGLMSSGRDVPAWQRNTMARMRETEHHQDEAAAAATRQQKQGSLSFAAGTELSSPDAAFKRGTFAPAYASLLETAPLLIFGGGCFTALSWSDELGEPVWGERITIIAASAVVSAIFHAVTATLSQVEHLQKQVAELQKINLGLELALGPALEANARIPELEKRIPELEAELEKALQAAAENSDFRLQHHSNLAKVVQLEADKASLQGDVRTLRELIERDPGEAAEGNSEVQHALDIINESNDSETSTKCLRVVNGILTKIVDSLATTDSQRDDLTHLLKCCAVNSKVEAFKDNISACIGGKELIIALHFSLHDDGKWRLPPALVIAHTTRYTKIRDQIRTIIYEGSRELAKQLSIQACTLIGFEARGFGSRSGSTSARWSDVDDELSLAIYNALRALRPNKTLPITEFWASLAAKSQLPDSALRLLAPSLLQSPSPGLPSSLQSLLHSLPPDLQQGLDGPDEVLTCYNADKEQFTVNLSQLTSTNVQSGVTRSISFQLGNGKPFEPCTLVDGDRQIEGDGYPTRQDGTAAESARVNADEAFSSTHFTLEYPKKTDGNHSCAGEVDDHDDDVDDTPTVTVFQWQFESDTGWTNYSQPLNDRLEAAKTSQSKDLGLSPTEFEQLEPEKVQVHFNDFTYEISLTFPYQQRNTETGKIRAVRRIPVSLPSLPTAPLSDSPGQNHMLPVTSISAQDAADLLRQNIDQAVQIVAVRRISVRPETVTSYLSQKQRMQASGCALSVTSFTGTAPSDLSVATRLKTTKLDTSVGVNETLAWHGSTVLGIKGIVEKGFVNMGGATGKARNANMFGTGIYLSPIDHKCRHIMATQDIYSARDKDGIKHLLLCAVLRGNVQEAKPGSTDFQAQDGYHTAADRDQVRYIVFQAQMNTNILPLLVVSFKIGD